MRARLPVVLLALAMMLIAACTAPPPAPTPAPSPAGAAFSVALNVAKDCGSSSGCSYRAELDGGGNKWQAQSGAAGASLSLGPGMPATLAPGDYTLNFFVFALTSPQTQMGSCATDFTVRPTDSAVVLRVAVAGPTCSISITPGG